MPEFVNPFTGMAPDSKRAEQKVICAMRLLGPRTGEEDE
jgi:hypothetical protein